MVEFVNHAKTAYGSTVSNWTTVQITNVGVHIGTETFLYHWEGGRAAESKFDLIEGWLNGVATCTTYVYSLTKPTNTMIIVHEIFCLLR